MDTSINSEEDVYESDDIAMMSDHSCHLQNDGPWSPRDVAEVNDAI